MILTRWKGYFLCGVSETETGLKEVRLPGSYAPQQIWVCCSFSCAKLHYMPSFPHHTLNHQETSEEEKKGYVCIFF